MKNLITFINHIFNSEEQVDNKTKYSILQWGCAFVHTTLIIFFLVNGVVPMVVFNIVSAVIYTACHMLIAREKYVLLYYITFSEVVLHSYTATILVGWPSGFAMYILAITPVVFYMHFSLSESATLKETLMIGLCAMLAFVTCKVISCHIEPSYVISERPAMIVYIYNSIITFVMILFFSLVFMREMLYSHNVLEKQNQRLDRMAGVDALTGLYNRRSLSKFLDTAVMSGRTYSIIMCDIDDFKKVNDTYGHDAGDEVLRSISSALTSSLRDGDYVCRWGGEEIVILATGTDVRVAAKVAERLRKAVDEMPITHGGQDIHCTITVSAADSTEKDNPSDIITLADNRLYAGKRSGKNCVVSA